MASNLLSVNFVGLVFLYAYCSGFTSLCPNSVTMKETDKNSLQLLNERTTFLNLSRCSKLYMDSLQLGRFTMLKTIDLRYSNLHSLPRNIFPNSINLVRKLFLAGNPLVCDCQLRWLLQLLLEHRIYVDQDATCMFNNNLWPLHKVPVESINCRRPRQLALDDEEDQNTGSGDGNTMDNEAAGDNDNGAQTEFVQHIVDMANRNQLGGPYSSDGILYTDVSGNSFVLKNQSQFGAMNSPPDASLGMPNTGSRDETSVKNSAQLVIDPEQPQTLFLGSSLMINCSLHLPLPYQGMSDIRDNLLTLGGDFINNAQTSSGVIAQILHWRKNDTSLLDVKSGFNLKANASPRSTATEAPNQVDPGYFSLIRFNSPTIDLSYSLDYSTLLHSKGPSYLKVVASLKILDARQAMNGLWACSANVSKYIAGIDQSVMQYIDWTINASKSLQIHVINPDQQCPQDSTEFGDLGKYTWDNTYGGVVQSKPCLFSYSGSGLTDRLCLINGTWAVPNLSQCVRPIALKKRFQTILGPINSTQNARDKLSLLYQTLVFRLSISDSVEAVLLQDDADLAQLATIMQNLADYGAMSASSDTIQQSVNILSRVSDMAFRLPDVSRLIAAHAENFTLFRIVDVVNKIASHWADGNDLSLAVGSSNVAVEFRSRTALRNDGLLCLFNRRAPHNSFTINGMPISLSDVPNINSSCQNVRTLNEAIGLLRNRTADKSDTSIDLTIAAVFIPKDMLSHWPVEFSKAIYISLFRSNSLFPNIGINNTVSRDSQLYGPVFHVQVTGDATLNQLPKLPHFFLAKSELPASLLSASRTRRSVGVNTDSVNSEPVLLDDLEPATYEAMRWVESSQCQFATKPAVTSFVQFSCNSLGYFGLLGPVAVPSTDSSLPFTTSTIISIPPDEGHNQTNWFRLELVDLFPMNVFIYAAMLWLLFCLDVTIITYIVCFRFISMQRKDKHCIINLCLSLFLLVLVFALGVWRVDVKLVCVATGLLLHYFVVAVLIWISLLIVNQLTSLSALRHSVHLEHGHGGSNEAALPKEDRLFRRPIVKYYMIGWGLPLPLVAVTAAIRFHDYFAVITQQYCFLRFDVTVWVLYIPSSCIVLMDLLLCLIVCCCTFKLRQRAMDSAGGMSGRSSSSRRGRNGKPVDGDGGRAMETSATTEKLLHAIQECDSVSVLDLQLPSYARVRFLLSLLAIYLFCWGCAAMLVAKPFMHLWVAFHDPVFSYALGLGLILLGLLIVGFFCVCRQDIRQSWSRFFCCRDQSGIESVHGPENGGRRNKKKIIQTMATRQPGYGDSGAPPAAAVAGMIDGSLRVVPLSSPANATSPIHGMPDRLLRSHQHSGSQLSQLSQLHPQQQRVTNVSQQLIPSVSERPSSIEPPPSLSSLPLIPTIDQYPNFYNQRQNGSAKRFWQKNRKHMQPGGQPKLYRKDGQAMMMSEDGQLLPYPVGEYSGNLAPLAESSNVDGRPQPYELVSGNYAPQPSAPNALSTRTRISINLEIQQNQNNESLQLDPYNSLITNKNVANNAMLFGQPDLSGVYSDHSAGPLPPPPPSLKSSIAMLPDSMHESYATNEYPASGMVAGRRATQMPMQMQQMKSGRESASSMEQAVSGSGAGGVQQSRSFRAQQRHGTGAELVAAETSDKRHRRSQQNSTPHIAAVTDGSLPDSSLANAVPYSMYTPMPYVYLNHTYHGAAAAVIAGAPAGQHRPSAFPSVVDARSQFSSAVALTGNSSEQMATAANIWVMQEGDERRHETGV